MGKRCGIIIGGMLSPLIDIEQMDFIIACDRGYQYAIQNGIEPDLLVGDFDSYTGPLPTHIPRLDLPVEKDDTDTMAALRWAIGQGYTDLRLYCAMGGRLDHLLGNIQCGAFAVSRGARLTMGDVAQELVFFTHSSVTLPKRSGYALSLLSLSDVCRDVTIEGAKYPLCHATVYNTFPIGISNEWQEDVTVTVGEGIALLIQVRLPVEKE